LACSKLQWACNAKHHAGWIEYEPFTLALGDALFTASAIAVLYLALEPYVRRRLPETLISWTRLLAGGWRDPLVGAHLLIGLAGGVFLSNLFFLGNLLIEPQASTQYGPDHLILNWLLDGRHIISEFVGMIPHSVGIALASLFVLFIFHLIFRRVWLACVAIVLLFCVFYALWSANFVLGAGLLIVVFGIAISILARYGVLALVALIAAGVLNACPLTMDFSAWYAENMFVAIGVVLVLAVYAFHVALAGRPIFRARFLEEQ